MSDVKLEPGQKFTIPCPFSSSYESDRFTGDVYGTWFVDGSKEIEEGDGTQTATIVSVHKPGRYPERVFFTCEYEDPDGATFGGIHLKVLTTKTFKQRFVLNKKAAS